MPEALRVAFISLLLLISLIAYFLTLRAFCPRRVAQTRAAADTLPGRSLAVGLVNFLFFGALTLILITITDRVGNSPLKILTLLPTLFFIALLGVGLSFGLAGVVELVGERLAPAQSAFRRTLWGTLSLSLGSALPFVGWFLLLPYAGLLGLGAFIISFFYREPRPGPLPPIKD